MDFNFKFFQKDPFSNAFVEEIRSLMMSKTRGKKTEKDPTKTTRTIYNPGEREREKMYEYSVVIIT